MNQELIDGLKRRFEMVEKNKHSNNHSLALLEYFSFIIKNPLILNTSKDILKNKNYFNDEILVHLLIASMQNENSSLIKKGENDRITKFLDSIVQGYEKEKGIKLTREDLGKLEAGRKQRVSEFEKEETLNNLSVFQNELIDNLSGARLKISLSFSRIKGIYLSSNPTKYYRPKGASNRLDYLEKLIKKNGDPLAEKALTKGQKKNPNSRFVVSGEIKEINELAMKKLSLKNKVILGESGYRVNTTDYDFILS
jgi:hypothetical protein